MDKEIEVKVRLRGWFPDIYDQSKPEGMSDENYINVIVSSWLQDKDEKNPISKS